MGNIQKVLDAIVQSMQRGTAAAIRDAVPVLSLLHAQDRVACHAYSRFIRERASEEMSALGERARSCGSVDERMDTIREMEELSALIEQVLEVNCQTDFDSYMLYMEWDREPHKRFYQPRRRTLLRVVRDLQDLFDDRLDFLSVSLPPRVGKSTLCIFFLTFVMGSNPLSANLMVGHSDTLTKSFWEEALSIITDDEEYRFRRVFPDAPFVGKSSEYETISLAKEKRFKTLTCRSIDGTLTGAVEVGPGSLLYGDDLVKKREEALNTRSMDKLYAAYLNQAKDRMKDGAKQLMVGTRWVPNDPIGRIQDEYAGDPRYRFTTIPALDENDESNFVYDYNLGFSTGYYLDQRRSLLSAGEDDSWYAKYQCSPFWREGVLYEDSELNYYEALPEDEEPDAIIAVCDTKTRGPDYCVQVIDYVYGERHYIHDVVCSDSLMDAITPVLAERLVGHRADMVRYESNVAGGSIAREVERLCREKGYGVMVGTKYSTMNKEVRIEADAGWVKTRCLFRCDSARGGEYDRFMHFLTSYSAKGKNAHDDVPDAMSMLKRFVEATSMTAAEVIDRPW